MVLRIAAFVIPLGLDTFAVAVMLGLRGLQPIRPAVVFAVFETGMPILGFIVGYHAGRTFETIAVYLSAAILVGIGIHSLLETRETGTESGPVDFWTLRGILLAGFGISLDEIAIGFPLGALQLPLAPVLLALGVQAFIVTVGGVLIGQRLGFATGLQASRAAGIGAGIAFVLLGCYLAAERI